MFLDPAPSLLELHTMFVLWEKILGHNNSFDEDFYYRLIEYQNTCSSGIPEEQLGRIQGVRDVGDSKPIGSYFSVGETNLTFIYSQLSTVSSEMLPYSKFFDLKSQELRRRVHLDNSLDLKGLVSRQLEILSKLKKAQTKLFEGDYDFATQIYNSIEIPKKNQLSLEGLTFDNFLLEKELSLSLIESMKRSVQFNEEFKYFYSQNSMDLFDEDQKLYDKLLDIPTKINFETENFVYSLDDVRFLGIANLNDTNSKISAYLLQNLVGNRNWIYSGDTTKFLKESLEK